MMTGAEWRKSSFSSSSNNCVQWQWPDPSEVRVRDSKDPDGPVLAFGRDEWQAFTAGVRAGECDPS